MPRSLLQNLIGEHFEEMPEAVRAMHSMTSNYHVQGVARVLGGKNLLARTVRFCAQLPPPALRTMIKIDFVARRDGEDWDRWFGRSRFHTIMRQEGPHLTEQMLPIPIIFVYQVRADHQGFSLHLCGLRLGRLPLPRIFWPKLAARARCRNGRYQFSTMVSFWFCGRVISYLGYLSPPTRDGN